jgi:hypothetical protein
MFKNIEEDDMINIKIKISSYYQGVSKFTITNITKNESIEKTLNQLANIIDSFELIETT